MFAGIVRVVLKVDSRGGGALVVGAMDRARAEPDAPEPGEGWGWVTGEALSYVKWIAGNPDDNVDEDVGNYHGYGDSPADEWNDLPSETPIAGFVEVDDPLAFA